MRHMAAAVRAEALREAAETATHYIAHRAWEHIVPSILALAGEGGGK